MKKRKRKLQTQDITVTGNEPQTEVPAYKSLTSLSELKLFILHNLPFILFTAVLIFVAYAGLINGQFLTADDIPGIVQNPLTKNLPEALRMFALQKIYFALIYSAFGMSSTAFHIGSIVMHVMNTFLVFVLAYILFGKKPAIIATLLFAVHPVNSEAVGWIAGNGYLFFAMFSLLSLISFALYKTLRKKVYLIISCAIFVLSMLTLKNPWTLITPFLIVIMDQYIFEKKINFKNILSYLPYIPFALFFVYKWVIIDAGTVVNTLQTDYYFEPSKAEPLLNRLPFTIYSMANLYVFPSELTIYPGSQIIPYAYYAFMFLSTIVIISLIFILRKKRRVFSGFILMMLAAIIPTYSPVVVAWYIADRYLYLGSVFFCIGLSLIILAAGKKYNWKHFVNTAVAIIVILYSVRTIVRAQDYQTNKGFWIATLKTAPMSERAYNNLGDAYATEGNYPVAIQYFAKSVEIKPTYADAIHNLGFTYMEAGDIENARKYLLLAYQVNPRLYQALFKLGYLEYQQKNVALAKTYFQKVIEMSPQSPEGQNATGILKTMR
jgi:protein O-mannosyl-transferase